MNEMIKSFQGSEVELEYLLTGADKQEVIMFVHGAGSNLRQFFEQHNHFSGQYKVLSVSLRGHGLSGHPKMKEKANYTLEKNRDDLIELLGCLDIDKLNFVGNSAGGLIGLYMYEVRPDLFSSIATFGTVGELNYSNLTTKLFSGIDKLMLRFNPRGYLGFLSKNISEYEKVQKEIMDLFMMSIEAVPYLRGNLGNYSCLDIIKNMTVPYLLIQGEQDKEINRSLGTTLDVITTNKRASVVKLEQAGHIANLDRPDEFNKILGSFWGRT